MYFTLMGKLNARRKNLITEDEKGFTLIELLVVVIIIGILAAIAIPVYLGVQNNAKDSGVKSDLGNAKTAVIALQTQNNKLPSAAADLGQVAGITQAGFTQGSSLGGPITFNPGTDGSSFCIAAVSTTNNYFYETDALGVTAGGTVSASTLPTTCTKPTVKALTTPTL